MALIAFAVSVIELSLALGAPGKLVGAGAHLLGA